MYSGHYKVKPPLGTLLNYPGLDGLIVLNGAGGEPREMISNAVGVISGSGTKPQWQQRSDLQGAPTVKFNGTGATSGVSYFDFGPMRAFRGLGQTGGPASLIAHVWWDGVNQGGIIERNDGNSVSHGFWFGVNNTGAGGSKLAFGHEYVTSNMKVVSSSAVPNSKWTTVAVTWTGSQTGGLNMYADGIDIGTSVTNGSGGTGSDGGDSVLLGNNTFDTSPSLSKGSWSGHISWVAAFTRKLDQAEVQAWSPIGPYPWALFATNFMRATTAAASTAKFAAQHYYRQQRAS